MKSFSNIGAFLRYGETLIAEVAAAGAAGVRVGAGLIEHEAKQELGTYQEAVGPFDAWADLAEATKADRVRQGYTPDDPGLRSGAMRAEIGVRADATSASIGSDDLKLLYFDQGTSKQPPRNVLGGSAVRMEERVVDAIAGRVVWALRGLGPRND